MRARVCVDWRGTQLVSPAHIVREPHRVPPFLRTYRRATVPAHDSLASVQWVTANAVLGTGAARTAATGHLMSSPGATPRSGRSCTSQTVTCLQSCAHGFAVRAAEGFSVVSVQARCTLGARTVQASSRPPSEKVSSTSTRLIRRVPPGRDLGGVVLDIDVSHRRAFLAPARSGTCRFEKLLALRQTARKERDVRLHRTPRHVSCSASLNQWSRSHTRTG